MFEIIRTEGCLKQNQTLFEESSIPWTHCYRQRNSSSCQKGPKNMKSPENKRCNAHLRKFRLLQYIHKEFACGFKTFQLAFERWCSIQMDKRAWKTFRTMKTELVKKLFLLYAILSTRSIFMLTSPALGLDASWYKIFQVENV